MSEAVSAPNKPCGCHWDKEYHRALNLTQLGIESTQCTNVVHPGDMAFYGCAPPVCTPCLFGCAP